MVGEVGIEPTPSGFSDRCYRPHKLLAHIEIRIKLHLTIVLLHRRGLIFNFCVNISLSYFNMILNKTQKEKIVGLEPTTDCLTDNYSTK